MDARPGAGRQGKFSYSTDGTTFTSLGTALALVLVIEGVLYALFPDRMKRIAARAMLVPPQSLRIAGLVAALLGVVLVWLLRR